MKKNNTVVILLAVAIILVLAIAYLVTNSNAKSSFVATGKQLAKVNGEPITEELVNLVMQGGQLTEENKKVVIDELVDNFIVYNEAVKAGMDKDPAIVNQLEMQKRLLIANKFMEKKITELEPIKEEDITAYYENNKEKLSKKLKLGIIVLAPNPSYADSIYKLIKSGKKSFETVAKEVSLDQATAKNGGILPDYVVYKQWASNGFAILDSMAFSLQKKGDVSAPFMELNGAMMLVKLVDYLPSNIDAASGKGYLLNLLYAERNRTYIASFVSTLKDKSKVEYIESQPQQ
ncbi:MAG: peptidylprolyl isomerase [bacterium]|nr:peptidylprolyl isomerase [bacterium]